VVVQSYNPSSQEIEAEATQIQDQPGLQSKTLTQKKKKRKKNGRKKEDKEKEIYLMDGLFMTSLEILEFCGVKSSCFTAKR
jgi:hypothetical protein